MTREEVQQAFALLAASPAAGWIGNKLVHGKLVVKCFRCGAERSLKMPSSVLNAFRAGARGDALAATVPSDFDARLFAFKRDFQIAHEGCLAKES